LEIEVMKTLLSFVFLLVFANVAAAWNGEGHEIVAYIAYQHLDAATRAKVDALLAKNPCFTEWQTAAMAVPATQRPVAIFMQAATWPDMIKLDKYDCQPAQKFVSDGTGGGDVAPSGPEASQNIGYTDTNRHQYWHFVDTPFSTDGTATELPGHPNALDEILTLSAALASSETQDLKSYDLVWIEHLVGDVHQPLHDTSRFTKSNIHGDRGGNAVLLCTTSSCDTKLHYYWDSILGAQNLKTALKTGKKLNARAKPAGADTTDPGVWVDGGFQLAKTDVYKPPISDDEPGSSPAKLNSAYHTNAKNVSQAQILLAGYRLAGMLNAALATH
jgi:S1/P1 Nuclease